MATRVRTIIEDSDPGFRRVIGRVSGPTHADIGWFLSKSPKVIERAIRNEFGVEDLGIPERSALRAGIKERINVFLKIINRGKIDMLLGRRTKFDVLNELGRAGVEVVRNKMVKGPFLKNADSTIARKGFDKPLFETDLLFNSTAYRIRQRGV